MRSGVRIGWLLLCCLMFGSSPVGAKRLYSWDDEQGYKDYSIGAGYGPAQAGVQFEAGKYGVFTSSAEVTLTVTRKKADNEQYTLKDGEDTLFLAKCIRKAKKIACIDKALYYYYVNDDSVTSGHYSAGKLTELKAWRRICEVFADEPFVYRSARAGYALRCREIVVKYCKDDAFMEQACAEAEREFKRNAGPLLAGWLRAGQYRYFIKTLYSYLLWNSWLKKKQARKTYEVEI